MSQDETQRPPEDELDETVAAESLDPEATVLFNRGNESNTEPARTRASGQATSDSAEHPAQIGRYAVRRVLGSGGFGCVYLAEDTELQREVAVKVPHERNIDALADVETFLEEARILASLDHPHIVPVYDIGRTPDGICYIVSRFIDGSSLNARIRETRMGYTQTAVTLASVADAMHYAPNVVSFIATSSQTTFCWTRTECPSWLTSDLR